MKWMKTMNEISFCYYLKPTWMRYVSFVLVQVKVGLVEQLKDVASAVEIAVGAAAAVVVVDVDVAVAVAVAKIDFVDSC